MAAFSVPHACLVLGLRGHANTPAPTLIQHTHHARHTPSHPATHHAGKGGASCPKTRQLEGINMKPAKPWLLLLLVPALVVVSTTGKGNWRHCTGAGGACACVCVCVLRVCL